MVGHICASITQLGLILEKSHPVFPEHWHKRVKCQKSRDRSQTPALGCPMGRGDNSKWDCNPGQFQSLFLLHTAVFRLYFLIKPMNSPLSWYTKSANPRTAITLSLLPQPTSLINMRNTAQVRELCATKIALSLPSWYFWVINTFFWSRRSPPAGLCEVQERGSHMAISKWHSPTGPFHIPGYNELNIGLKNLKIFRIVILTWSTPAM